jgi:outer membrane protein TolC
MSGLWLALVLLPILLAGCATVVEEPHAVRPAAPAQWRDSPTAPRDAAGRWWQDYGDPQLTGLVETALAANADVAMAGERLALVRARLAAAEASGSPTVNCG